MFGHSELITHIRKFEGVRQAKIFLLRQLPKKISFLIEIIICWNFISQHMYHKQSRYN